MNLKEEIKKKYFEGNVVEHGLSDKAIVEIAEAYAKEKAWEAFKQGEKTAIAIRCKIVIPDDDLRRIFNEWWEDNK